ncbi:MAG: branched-chain amino acid ABC transporter permease [Alphaproteobacteria bacterium]|nr:branched-chain amino acid ABC transporter permease [Alphaproteobacteria bacterium]
MKALARIWNATNPRARGALALFFGALLIAPLFADRYLLSVLIQIFYFAVVGQAWNVMMGFAGQLSLGHALYVGIGAYVSAALWVKFGIGPWAGAIAAIAACVALGLIVGALGFRFGIEGVYFAMLTIAIAEFVRIAFDHMEWTGKAGGFFLPVRADAAGEWWNLRGGPLLFYYVGLALMAGAFVICAMLRRSRIGHQWLAIREDEQAARALGIDVFRAKLVAVAISSAMTGIGGVFYAFYYNNLFPAQVFDISRSIELILGPIVGGLGTLFGPILGAFILTPLGEALIGVTERLGVNVPGAKAVFYGLALMAIIYVSPSGVWPWLKKKLGLA